MGMRDIEGEYDVPEKQEGYVTCIPVPVGSERRVTMCQMNEMPPLAEPGRATCDKCNYLYGMMTRLNVRITRKIKEDSSMHNLEAMIEDAARMAHEINRIYCMNHGDYSQQPWEAASERQKGSVRSGVRMYMQNPWQDPKKSHDNWMAYKLREGWTYGPVKSEADKIHPCLLPWDELPEREQKKDSNFQLACALVCIHAYGWEPSDTVMNDLRKKQEEFLTKGS